MANVFDEFRRTGIREQIVALRREGLPDDEIRGRLSKNMLTARQRGMSDRDIATLFGVDEAAVHPLVQSTFQPPPEEQRAQTRQAAHESFTREVGSEPNLSPSQMLAASLLPGGPATPTFPLTAVGDALRGRNPLTAWQSRGEQMGLGFARNIPSARIAEEDPNAGTVESLLSGLFPQTARAPEGEELGLLDALEGRALGGFGQALPDIAMGGATEGAGALARLVKSIGRGATESAGLEAAGQAADRLILGEDSGVKDQSLGDALGQIGLAGAAGGTFAGAFSGAGELLGKLGRRPGAPLTAADELEKAVRAIEPEARAIEPEVMDPVRAAKRARQEAITEQIRRENLGGEQKGTQAGEELKAALGGRPLFDDPAGDFGPPTGFRNDALEDIRVWKEVLNEEPPDLPKLGELFGEDLGFHGRPDADAIPVDAGRRAPEQPPVEAVARTVDDAKVKAAAQRNVDLEEPDFHQKASPDEVLDGIRSPGETPDMLPALPRAVRRGVLANALAQIVPNFRLAADWIADRRVFLGQLRNLDDMASAQGRRLLAAAQSVAERKQIFKVRDGKAAVSTLPRHVREVVDAIWQETDDAAAELVAMGVLNKESYEAMRGTWQRRVYLQRLLGDKWEPPAKVHRDALTWLQKNRDMSLAEANEFLGKLRSGDTSALDSLVPSAKSGSKMNVGQLKQRKDIAFPIRKFMGEVDDGVFTSIDGLVNTKRLLEEAKFFRQMQERLPEYIAHGANDASVNFRKHLESKIGNVSDLQAGVIGKTLLDAHVPLALADDIASMYALQAQTRDIGDRIVSAFKFNKVIANPGSYVRNFVGNTLFAHNAGLRPWDAHHMVAAINDVFERNDIFKEAMGAGVHGTEFFRQEKSEFATQMVERIRREQAKAARKGRELSTTEVVGAMMEEARAALEKWNGAKDRLSQVYDAMDQVWKQAVYRKATLSKIDTGRIRQYGGEGLEQVTGALPWHRQKLTPVQAAQHVNLYFPNYTEIGGAFQAIRGKTGGGIARKVLPLTMNPFIAFPVEAARNWSNAFFYKPMAAATGIGATGLLMKGMWGAFGASPDEVEYADQSLPNYKRFPNRLMAQVPWRTDDGNLQVVDITSIVPLGDLLRGYRMDPSQSNAENATTALTSMGRETFLNGPLSQILETQGYGSRHQSAASKGLVQRGLEGAADAFLPGLTPGVPGVSKGGFGYEEIKRAVEGKTDEFGERISLTRAIINQAGFRSLEITPGVRGRAVKQAMAQQADIDRRVSQIKKEFEKGKIDQKDVAKRMQNVREDVVRLVAYFEDRFSAQGPTAEERLQQISQDLVRPGSVGARNALVDEEKTLQDFIDSIGGKIKGAPQ